MAIYHLSVQTIGRGSGRSSTAAAAYRAGCEITDERTGQVHDYTHKGGVVGTEIMAPDHSPEWVNDREQLWNAVELGEKRKDARVAREINVAIPDELDWEQGQSLVREYVQEQFVDRGMVADIAFHEPNRAGDERNKHAHIMLTTREISADGFGKKERAWNDRELVTAWRERWQEHANTALERSGHDARIDHRSLEAQGIERQPTTHLGPQATAMERRGLTTARGDINRERVAANDEIMRVEQKIVDLNQRRLQDRADKHPNIVKAEYAAAVREASGVSQAQAKDALSSLEAEHEQWQQDEIAKLRTLDAQKPVEPQGIKRWFGGVGRFEKKLDKWQQERQSAREASLAADDGFRARIAEAQARVDDRGAHRAAGERQVAKAQPDLVAVQPIADRALERERAMQMQAQQTPEHNQARISEVMPHVARLNDAARSRGDLGRVSELTYEVPSRFKDPADTKAVNAGMATIRKIAVESRDQVAIDAIDGRSPAVPDATEHEMQPTLDSTREREPAFEWHDIRRVDELRQGAAAIRESGDWTDKASQEDAANALEKAANASAQGDGDTRNESIEVAAYLERNSGGTSTIARDAERILQESDDSHQNDDGAGLASGQEHGMGM